MDSIFIIPIFIVGWLFVSAIISLLGGWYWVAKKYPYGINQDHQIKKFYWKSMHISPLCSYSSCVNISVFSTGFVLKPIFIFTFLHRPIFLKWGEIKNPKFRKKIFSNFSFYAGERKISIYGKAAMFLNSLLEQRAI